MERVILHSDLNNFYASCECLVRPELKGLPVVVCGKIKDRHGVVLAKNMLAKFGIEIYPGVTGMADSAVEKLLNGTLMYNLDSFCNHHHGGEEHSCSGDCHGCH